MFRCLYGFNTQPPEGGWFFIVSFASTHFVSTLSRPKAAADSYLIYHILELSFNTQPPEGGWYSRLIIDGFRIVSTLSRPKAAEHFASF